MKGRLCFPRGTGVKECARLFFSTWDLVSFLVGLPESKRVSFLILFFSFLFFGRTYRPCRNYTPVCVSNTLPEQKRPALRRFAHIMFILLSPMIWFSFVSILLTSFQDISLVSLSTKLRIREKGQAWKSICKKCLCLKSVTGKVVESSKKAHASKWTKCSCR